VGGGTAEESQLTTDDWRLAAGWLMADG